MGPLSKQRQDQKFSWCTNDMQAAIKAQAQKIYVGDKAKFLTGADKVPDWLRAFISQIRRNLESFRLQSIRELRKICIELNGQGLKIAEALLPCIAKKASASKKDGLDKLDKQMVQLFQKTERAKQQNLRRLRPNLRNPVCKA